ncbi:hypothetical protein PSENEW3n2_00003758 [Picochlorum sp. SENEW3]|nr:hypothetical protein PSENEW3n2_00003758 [Picochlorum sp. SENEW3]WPT18458.1 hypothetical protein PSENEW3_00003758 [Picochlorum sp. SENEW3]
MEDTTDVSSSENSPGKGFEANDGKNKPEWKIRLHVDSRIVEFRENSIDILVDVMSTWMRKQASGNPNNVSIKMKICFTQDIPIDYSEAQLQTLINAQLRDFPTKYSSCEKSMDIYMTSNKPGEHNATNNRPGCDEQHNKRTAEDFVREFSNRMYQLWLSADNIDVYAVHMLQYHLSTMLPEYTDIIERIMNTKRNTQYATSNRAKKRMKISGSTTPPSR